MKNRHIHDVLRERLELAAGIWPKPTREKPLSMADLEKEFSERFVGLMRNRILMGTLRYGQMSMRPYNQRHFDHCADAIRRIKKYQTDGNMEHLVDAANMLMVEFEVGIQPNRHFSASDDGEHAKRF